MNQIAFYNIEKEIEGRVYRFSMQMGGQWSEAVTIASDIAAFVKELSDLSAKQIADQANAQPQDAPKAELTD